MKQGNVELIQEGSAIVPGIVLNFKDINSI